MNEIRSVSNNNECHTFNPDKPIDGQLIIERPYPFNPDKEIGTVEILQKYHENFDPDKELNTQDKVDQIIEEYFNDLKDKSDCPETLPDKPFDASDLKKRTPEENAAARNEFDDKKTDLKKEWEKENGRQWPKYEHDVYSSNGKLIRSAGSDYDAHHILPLSMGGKNEVRNITPLNAEVHYDKQGVHAPESPYSKLEKALGGTQS